MRKSSWLILTLVLLAVGGPTALRATDITYTVNLSVGPGSVIGTITTDGTIGTLSTGDIVGWNLILNDGTTTVPLAGRPPESHDFAGISGSDLTATATALLYNFGGPDFDFFEIQNDFFTLKSGGVLDFFTPNPGDSSFPTSGIRVSHLAGNGITVNAAVSGTQVIASVTAPEPATVALMLPAIGFLLAARKRLAQRHHQAI